MATTTGELSDRGRAVLRAVRDGRCELTGGAEPDLYVDGLAFCDQLTTRQLARAGLLRQAGTGSRHDRHRVGLTRAGEDALADPGHSAA